MATLPITCKHKTCAIKNETYVWRDFRLKNFVYNILNLLSKGNRVFSVFIIWLMFIVKFFLACFEVFCFLIIPVQSESLSFQKVSWQTHTNTPSFHVTSTLAIVLKLFQFLKVSLLYSSLSILLKCWFLKENTFSGQTQWYCYYLFLTCWKNAVFY